MSDPFKTPSPEAKKRKMSFSRLSEYSFNVFVTQCVHIHSFEMQQN